MDKVKYEGRMIDHPCNHCINPKNHSNGPCTEMCCYCFSRFVAEPDTPQDTINYVLDTQDSMW